MDEEERLLRESLMGQNPMMQGQPILNVEDNRLGGNAQEVLGLTGALAGIRTNPFLTGSMNQAAPPSLNPATGPGGGTRLPTQPSLEQASRAASRTAGMGSYSGTTGELSRGKGFDLNSNRIGSSFFSNIAKGATQGIIGAPSLVLNPNEMGDATLSGANQRAAEQGLSLPFPDAPNAEALQLLKPSSAESEVEQKPGFFEPGGFGYENLGPRLGANIGQFAGEQLYGTGFTADGDPTGFPVDRPTLAGDLLTLPGTALNVASIVTDPLVTATEGTISGVKNLKDYVTGDTGVQAQQEKAAESLANQGITSESVSQDLAQSVPQEDQSLINSVQVDTGTDVASIPQGETGSPQANFSERMASGKPLTQEEITAANAFAKSMGTTFNPETGYSRDAFLGSQATAPRSDTFPNDAGVQRTRDELMRRFGAPTISQIQEQDAIRTSGNVAIPAPAAVNNFAPQTPSVRATPAPFPNTEGREIRDALFRGNPQQGAVPAFSTESGTRPNVDPGFIQQPSLRDPDAGFIRPAPNLSDFERESLARESRLDARPDFNEAISDRDRRAARGEGLSQADARDLAQGMDPNASEGQRMRALEIQSRLGLGQFKPEKELSDLEKREIESRIRGRDADIAALERKGGFEPRVIDVGGERAMELSPGYFQRIAKDTPKKTGLQTTIENLQSDLDSGRLTQEQYDIAVSNAKNLYIGLKQPKQNETDVSNRISELQNQAMGVTSAEGTDASDVKSYATEAEAKASGVKGEVLIGGRRAVIE